MKKLVHVISFLLVISCKPEDVTPTTPANSTFDTSKATLLKKGDLVGINHTASGVAAVYDSLGKKTVLLDPFSSQSGPDLKVYLSKDVDATDYIRLGQLQSTSGKQSYDVPGNPDINLYHYVHIWCEKYTVVFARAELK